MIICEHNMVSVQIITDSAAVSAGLQELRGAFDFVLIDPPFITREVWEKYAITARRLTKAGAH